MTASYSWEQGAETRTPSNTCSKCELNPELCRPQGIRDFPNCNEQKSPPRAGAPGTDVVGGEPTAAHHWDSTEEEEEDRSTSFDSTD
ncbi:hypothetical protein PIB30_083505 [Stylosanthes scabra]|uniref:Uncharacterized protein n=1 Tax=Stylosanthes scabra TaxID=79078 RepID=A0ABU6SSI2_9FABA|nr:hypothetical protein [Stylosanthes scabra]